VITTNWPGAENSSCHPDTNIFFKTVSQTDLVSGGAVKLGPLGILATI
jgi:hypothetical protein